MSSGKLDYDRYVVSEVFPVSVLDQDTGDSYPIADGIGFVEEMCKLLNEFNEEKLENECRLKRKSRKITDLANFNVELMEKNKELKAENEQLKQENELLKKGIIEVVDRHIRNVEHNPPSSTRTYLKVKGALDNVREGLRDLLADLE